MQWQDFSNNIINDLCPVCNKEIEPDYTENLDEPDLSAIDEYDVDF